ncbi:DUF4240 domain-containing protein [Actinomadura violacea]|uniref:DUF4240 domain-containing protein n=1 Tax=Actinomadura violacea TaxID=2819934 RepID=A0ABS3S4T3_9ACTN|nr:DUF4240 domain-containing protein [Actinomadura violacea]MBO2463583.1 DUF4240 domain-containing protein [Actinomadura violacea]
MHVDEFWGLVEAARRDEGPFSEALTAQLAALPAERILEFQERFSAVDTRVYRWDVWAAAYLIGGGCSDDCFTDFRAGLVALGREWFERVVQSPDDLADHPLVIEAAAKQNDYVIFYEEVGYAAGQAFDRVTGTDTCEFYEALERRQTDREPAVDLGEGFDFDDEEQMRQRLPRLTALLMPQESS